MISQLHKTQTTESSIKKLIEMQRRYSVSSNSFERVVGTMLIAARLRKFLSVLPDDAIAQLLFDRVWNAMDVFSPEMTICQEATERLLNSCSVVQTRKENLDQ